MPVECFTVSSFGVKSVFPITTPSTTSGLFCAAILVLKIEHGFIKA